MSVCVRHPRHRYEDPLARVWIAAARRIGFRVERTSEAYASTDGRGTILIATDDGFDPDDSLAQMILHELCHALVEGDAGERRVDWGLGVAVGTDPWREHACLRVQAWLADSVGLRDFFAPTTDFRVSFWDSLPADPFAAPQEAGGRRERSCVAGRIAAWRSSLPRWASPLREALAATAAIAALVPRPDRIPPAVPAMEAESIAQSAIPTGLPTMREGDEKPLSSAGRGIGERGFAHRQPSIASNSTASAAPTPLPSLWTMTREPPSPHPAGHAPIAAYPAGKGCGECAWGFSGRGGLRCRHAPKLRLPSGVPACTRFEPARELDCRSCGACCREAYQAVEVSPREPVNRRHPKLVLVQEGRHKLRREGGRCAALAGGRTPLEPYACDIYPNRPRTCREFTLGSSNCLDARRRVGLSL